MTPIKQSELLNSESFLTTASCDVLEAHVLARAGLIEEFRNMLNTIPSLDARPMRRARQGILKDAVAQELYNVRFMCGVLYSRFGMDPVLYSRVIDTIASVITVNPELELEWFECQLTDSHMSQLVALLGK